jgi:hypothetical protein
MARTPVTRRSRARRSRARTSPKPSRKKAKEEIKEKK